MVGKICLDTSFIVELLRGSEHAAAVIKENEAEYALSSVTVFELLIGSRNDDRLLGGIRGFILLDFDCEAAKIAAGIYRKLKEQGKLVDMRDVFVAAVCIKNDFELLTLNKKHFDRLKEFGLRLAWF